MCLNKVAYLQSSNIIHSNIDMVRAKLYQNHLEYYIIFMNSHNPGFFAGLKLSSQILSPCFQHLMLELVFNVNRGFYEAV